MPLSAEALGRSERGHTRGVVRVGLREAPTVVWGERVRARCGVWAGRTKEGERLDTLHAGGQPKRTSAPVSPKPLRSS
eukprot:78532-Prymnesium_polylepis.1